MSTTVQGDTFRYTTADDRTAVLRVLLTGRVRDAFTGRGRSCRLSTDPTGLRVRMLDGGWYAVSGYPERAFPRLSATDYTIRLHLEAEGYLPQSQLVEIPTNAGFPLTVVDILLRSRPVRLAGRVTQETDPHPPISGARIFAQDPAQHAVLVRIPLVQDQGSGTVVREITLTPTPVVGPPKQLARPAARGEDRVWLNDRQGLLAGRILRVSDPIAGQMSRIQSVSLAPADLSLPGEVVLEAPLSRSFGLDTPCTELLPAVVNPPDKHLQRPVAAGEAVLLLDAAVTSPALEVAPSLGSSEYLDVGVLTDAEGYYAADGLGGVSSLRLNVAAAGFATPAAPRPLFIGYDRAINLADWQL